MNACYMCNPDIKTEGWGFLCNRHYNNMNEVKMPKRTMTRRFYSTISAIRYPPLLRLYSEALADAKRKLDEKPELGDIYIVEVKTVIRRTDIEQPPYDDLLAKLEAIQKEIDNRKTAKFVIEEVQS